MQPFDPDTDCKRLHEAMDGLGTNEDAIIDIIPHRSNKQRQDLKLLYQDKYGRVFTFYGHCFFYLNKPSIQNLLVIERQSHDEEIKLKIRIQQTPNYTKYFLETLNCNRLY